MGNLENYQSGEQMDLPEVGEAQEGGRLVQEKKEVPGSGPSQSEITKNYLTNRTEKDKERDNCPECGGSGDWCRSCRRKGLIE